ncbi:DNA-directed RNA polymerase subunit beta [Paenibacillus darwinianus]|nr:DNA-directed RNA polymerase subunit beta [Paenibacillus darwinianus]
MKKQPSETAEEIQRTAGEASRRRPAALRIALRILRFCLVPALCVAALLGGLYVGYVILGKAPAEDVWQWGTWKHMYDLVFSES